MKVAVIIAVEKYSDARMEPVEFAAADAMALAVVLEQHGFDSVNRLLLVDDQATKSRIESRVKRILKGLREGDELIFYCACHSFSMGGSNFVTCYDTDPDDLADTSIALSWLLRQFSKSDCRRNAFFLDLRAGAWQAADGACDIDPDPSDAELEEFFAASQYCVGFVSHKVAELSHSSRTLQHGIWASHVIDAFAGKAPSALVQEAHLTPASLQAYLSQEVARTLATTFATKTLQTPWMAGNGKLPLADLTEILAQRMAAANPHAGQIKNIAFLAERTQGVRNLSGFKKTQKEPISANSAADTFIAHISRAEITDDVEGRFSQLKSAFHLKRTDVHISNGGDGTATIITPYFSYSITVRLDAQDTSQVIFRRTVDAIKQPDQILSAAFALVFENAFDTVEFESPGPMDLPALVDRIEVLNDDRITIDYDPAVTRCRLQVEGEVGALVVTPRSLSLVHTRPRLPKDLLLSFFEIQNILVGRHNLRLIPLDD